MVRHMPKESVPGFERNDLDNIRRLGERLSEPERERDGVQLEQA